MMAEGFPGSAARERCGGCDWRWRCGGVDASVLLMAEAAHYEADGQPDPPFVDLYCEPRRQLFEEMLWGAAEVAERPEAPGARERIQLRQDGIDFLPVAGAEGSNDSGAEPVPGAPSLAGGWNK